MRPIRRLGPIVSLLLVALTLLTTASSGVAATRVVGGMSIRIQTAPWAVVIRQAAPGGARLCSGSILDSLHVLTAAHCIYNASGAQASITSFLIRAGVSNYAVLQPGEVVQDRGVSSLRVHPGYVHSPNGTADDIAVLALSAPLDLNGSTVAAVTLPGPSFVYPARAEAAFAGFGRTVPTVQQDGSLNWLPVTVEPQGRCGGYSNNVIPEAAAVAFCALSLVGTSCAGDSGSGLVTTTGVPTLIGVVSAVANLNDCAAGDATILTYLGAPEILKFVQGDDHPPVAPRMAEGTFLRFTWPGSLRAGNTVTCATGNWYGEPTLAYAFLSSRSGEVLQQGAKGTYRLAAADVGDALVCRAMATNAGGTASIETRATTEIGSAPVIGIAPVAPVKAKKGRTATVRVVLYTPPGLTGKFAVCITPPVQVGQRICASQFVDEGSVNVGPSRFSLGLGVKPTAPLGTSRLTINAVAGFASTQKAALVRISRPAGTSSGR